MRNFLFICACIFNATFLSAGMLKSIRDVDLKNYIIERDGLQGSEKSDCDGRPLFTSFNVEYADLTGDGREEAVLTAMTCIMGTGGANYMEVLQLDENGKITQMPFDTSSYKGNLHEGQHHSAPFLLNDGKLTSSYLMYGYNQPAKKSGYTRTITYKWNGKKFIVGTVKDIPPALEK